MNGIARKTRKSEANVVLRNEPGSSPARPLQSFVAGVLESSHSSSHI